MTVSNEACATMDRAIARLAELESRGDIYLRDLNASYERIAFLEARVTDLQAANERYRERAALVGGLNDRVILMKMDNDRLRRGLNEAIGAMGRALS